MTANDAARIRKAGAQAIQINTGAGCHLEADMIADATKRLELGHGAILMIENVGNLVCPSMFDLGEFKKVAVISSTEGEDKPLKYPHMFQAADCVIINKIDIAAVVEFDQALCEKNIRTINPNATIIPYRQKLVLAWSGMILSANKHANICQWTHGGRIICLANNLVFFKRYCCDGLAFGVKGEIRHQGENWR